jgi:hypothetical protein
MAEEPKELSGAEIAAIVVAVLKTVKELSDAVNDFIDASSVEGITPAKRQEIRDRIRERGEEAAALRDKLLSQKIT